MSDYQTPRKEDEAEKSLDDEDDLNDRENAEEFYTLMKEKGHCFGTCKGKLLYDVNTESREAIKRSGARLKKVFKIRDFDTISLISWALPKGYSR